MSVIEKKLSMRELETGDIVLLTNGNEYEFIRLKQSKFLGKRNGVTYDIPIAMFDSCVAKLEKEKFDASTLKENDLFYILNSKQEPVVFRFQYMLNVNKVKAKNPATGQDYRIPSDIIEGNIMDWIMR